VRVQIAGIGTLSLAEVEVIRVHGKCTGTTSIGSRINSIQDILVYPNPVNGSSFYVELPENFTTEKPKFQLFDGLGRSKNIEIKGGSNCYQIAVSENIQPGIYFLVVNDGKDVLEKKVIFLKNQKN
jgi:hypothetical protein